MSDKTINIAFGKIGKPIIFDSTKWAAIGGNNEAPTLLLRLAKLNPDKTFYIIGRTDFSRHQHLKEKYKNIIDIWEFYLPEYREEYNIKEKYRFPVNFCKKHNIKFDFGIFFTGITCQINLLNFLRKKTEPEKSATPSNTAINYGAPVVEFLNKTNIPWIALCTDPRQYPLDMRDLTNQPKSILSQIDYSLPPDKDYIHASDPDDYNSFIVDSFAPLKYAGIESMILMSKQKITKEQFLEKFQTTTEKDKKLTLILHEGYTDKKLSRFNIIKEYFIDTGNRDKVLVIGKWQDKYYETYPDIFIPSVDFTVLQTRVLPRIKYTFIIPIYENWSTAKIFETVSSGIIPFLHKSYDGQQHLKIPDFLRVDSPAELQEKLRIIQSNKDLRLKIVSELYDNLLLDDYYSGKYMSDIINLEFEKHRDK